MTKFGDAPVKQQGKPYWDDPEDEIRFLRKKLNDTVDKLNKLLKFVDKLRDSLREVSNDN